MAFRRPPDDERIESSEVRQGESGEEIAVMAPSHRRAVPWTIAVNAGHGGVRPFHMPIVMAAVRGACRSPIQHQQMGAEHPRCCPSSFSMAHREGARFRVGAQLIREARTRSSEEPSGSSSRTSRDSFRARTNGAPSDTRWYSRWPKTRTEVRGKASMSSWLCPGRETVTLCVPTTGTCPSPTSTSDKSGAQVTLEVICRELVKKKAPLHVPGSRPSRREKRCITIVMSRRSRNRSPLPVIRSRQ